MSSIRTLEHHKPVIPKVPFIH